MEPPVPIPNTEVKRRSANGSRTIGPARVGRCQINSPLTLTGERAVLVWRGRAQAEKAAPKASGALGAGRPVLTGMTGMTEMAEMTAMIAVTAVTCCLGGRRDFGNLGIVVGGMVGSTGVASFRRAGWKTGRASSCTSIRAKGPQYGRGPGGQGSALA